MASLIAVRLRDLARRALMEAGGRGFMRFAEGEDALFVTDAVRRCSDVPALVRAMEVGGFACLLREGLLFLTPADALLRAFIGPQEPPEIDWEEPNHLAQALAARWLCAPEAAFTDAGRRLVLEALRLTGTPGRDVTGGLEPLRAHAAVMLRAQDRSGMREAGAILREWCDTRSKTDGHKEGRGHEA